MNYNMWVYLAVSAGIIVGAVACATVPPAPGEAVQCTENLPARIVKLVYVDVAAGPNGPVITPEVCAVRSGTQVLWRTAEDVLDPFALAFAESPGAAASYRSAANTGQKDFDSQRMGRRQEVLIVAKAVVSENNINYDVRIGSSHLDPGIKIMPR
ncbi:MAG: hypothetical protein ACN6OR_07570 [Stenotrophomonas sp.]|uniref:hypothetical protein n=1 Tax=Stenotrophomonas sp. TaxID=69392 RepID=UPI0028A6780E|nr:hypothetical protein [Stenotrophomonas sp.]